MSYSNESWIFSFHPSLLRTAGKYSVIAPPSLSVCVCRFVCRSPCPSLASVRNSNKMQFQGSGFVITREAAQRIIENICSFPHFTLDDVFMGILANCLGIRLKHLSGFDCYIADKFVVFHYQWTRYSTEQLRHVWRTVNKSVWIRISDYVCVRSSHALIQNDASPHLQYTSAKYDFCRRAIRTPK